MVFDHAQSPRLGQPTPVENPGVQLCTLETLPEAAYRGQIVYRLDDDVFQVYDGVAWQNPTVYNAGGTQTFVGAISPVADAIGDLWLSTTDYQLYTWDGRVWQHVTSTRSAAEERSLVNLALAVQVVTPAGTVHVRIFYDTTLPLAPAQNDLYVDKNQNKVFQYAGTTWTEITGGTAVVINAAGYERFIPDGVIDIFFQIDAPLGLGPYDIGDLWIVTSLNNLVRYWTGAQWQDLQITQGQIANAAIGSPQIQPNAVDGQVHVIDHTIVTRNLADNVITTDKLDDFAVAVTKFNTKSHLIY